MKSLPTQSQSLKSSVLLKSILAKSFGFLNETSTKGGTSVIRRERFLNRYILSTAIVNYFVSNLQTSDRRKVMPKLL